MSPNPRAVTSVFAVFGLALSLVTAVVAQNKTDREKENLKGPVRLVRSESRDYIEQTSPDKGRVRQLDTVTYDRVGNEIERTIYNDYGFLVGKEVRTRDADGNLVESVLTDPKGAIMEKKTYVYDAGNLLHIDTYDAKGRIGVKQVNSYDAAHRVRDETYYDPKIARGKTVYKYDGNGKLAEVAFYLANGAKAVAPIGPCLGAHRVAYSYDSQGRPERTMAYEPDGEIKTTWQYTYASEQEVVEYVKEDVWSRIRFVYEYDRDSHGNWIRQMVTIEDEPKLSERPTSSRKKEVSREIEYYK
jgi:hypothetical protein